MSLVSELKRRNVFRVAAAYIVVAWLLIQVAETIFPLFGFNDTPARLVVIVLAIGLLPAIALAWAYELTPEGLKKDGDAVREGSITKVAGKKLDRAILVVLALALGYFAFDKFVLDPARDESIVASARQEGRTEALIDSYGNKSIAVLPFLDMSVGKDQEYMSDGIAEELLNLLARIPELRVISRSSAFAFKGKDIDIPDVAQKLNVAYVLEGSVRTAGEQIRITAQLIEAGSDTHLWSETYDRKLENIFDIQDEISTLITASLKVNLLDGDQSSVESQRLANVDAHNAYLIGKERMELRTKEDIEAARAQFEKAIEIDEKFAPAHVELAHAWLLLEKSAYGGDTSHSEDVDGIVNVHLDRALELAPNLPEGFGVRGYHHLQRYRDTEARDALDRAISLNPNYALAYDWRANIAFEEERFMDMLADREKAYSLDPMSLQIGADLAAEYRNFWRPRDAERVINRMFDRHPDHPLAYRAAILNLGMHGRHAEAQILQDKALTAHPEDQYVKRTLPIGLYLMGFFEEVEALEFDHFKFSAYMVDRRYEEAKALLEKNQDENTGRWRNNARWYYRVAAGQQSLSKLSEAVDKAIASWDNKNYPWREQCAINLIYDMRIISHEDTDAIDSMMAQCDIQFEARLRVGYICPCEAVQLISYTILDGRFDEAIERAEQWLGSWPTIALAIDPIFALLADRPDYQSLLDRNDELLERQRQIYQAGQT
jgi:TolB-like protein